MAENFQDCKKILDSEKPAFLSLLENHIDLDSIVPISFRNHFYASTGRTRKYPLNAMLWALIIQRIFSIPTDSLLLVFLQYSKDLREFCVFSKVPDASKITRFKQDFLSDLQSVFDNLVDLTEPICQAIDAAKADMTVFDTSGIEVWVTENNPKYANKVIKLLKAYTKANHFDSNYDPYKAVYGSMPSHAAANDQIKQLYVDGRFCYVCIIGIVTNGLGIIRHLDFYNKDFLAAHPELIPNRESDFPDEDKSIHDARLLIPTLQDSFKAHPLINSKTFLGDASFDSVNIYAQLLAGDTLGRERHFSTAYIPLNESSKLKNPDFSINEDGIPCCPKDKNLSVKPEGAAKTKAGLTRFKFVCPKTSWVYNPAAQKTHRKCNGESPCTDSKCGRMVCTQPQSNLRAYPRTLHGTEVWNNTYKTRTAVERSINHFKDNFYLADRRTPNFSCRFDSCRNHATNISTSDRQNPSAPVHPKFKTSNRLDSIFA